MYTEKNIKRLLVLAAVMVACINTFGVPAKRIWRSVTLANGTPIEVMLVGDEHGHWLVDRSGKALSTGDDGLAYYMTDDQLTACKNLRKERAARSNARRVTKINKTRALSTQATSGGARKTFGKPTTITGQKKGIVILVNYSDKSFKAGHDQTLFERRFNEVGYSDEGYIGSVHDYFYDQSYGKFDLSFDVVGPVTVSKTHDYYGANNSQGNDKYAAAMVIEALKLADAMGVDFSKYDWDGDGEVDQVFVIYAGTGENASDNAKDIWPHEYALSSAKQDRDGTGAQTIDGVMIDTYACSCELTKSSTIDGIGTACHEFSHCLGYADLYDTDYSGGQGMEDWDLLDSGSYNGPDYNGEVPAAYTSFERWWAGWMDLTVLDKPQIIKDMPALNDTAVAYKIVNDAHPNEYYILENRQAKHWDSYTAGNGDGTGHGMMILHVDYDENTWVNNAPNDDPSHQRMTFFAADNSYGTKLTYDGQYYWSETYAQKSGDPYPGTSKNTSFTNESKPAATLYNANTDGTMYMGKSITDITETNGLISFTFMGGSEIPVVDSDIVTSASGFTASWNSIADATCYTARAIAYTPNGVKESVLLKESFGKASGNTNTDISSSLDNYSDNKGWTGYKIYPYVGTLKIGSSNNNGYLLSPTLTSTSGYLTVVLSTKAYNTTSTSSVKTNLCSISGDEQKTVDSSTLTTRYEEHVFSFEATSLCRLKFNFTNRAYVNGITVYDGNFTAEEISLASSSKALIPLYAETKTSGDTIYVDGLTDTNVTFTSLTAEKYTFQVRANYSDGISSSWSSPVMVTFDLTGIANVQSDALSSDSRIYSINGQLVGYDLESLPKGIYIRGGRKLIKR